MNNSKLKKYWQIMFIWRDQDTGRFSINPVRAWFVLACLFFTGLIVVFVSISFLKWQIFRTENMTTDNPGATVEKLNEQKLKLILIDQEERTEEFDELKLAKPKVIDPGV
jgi:hypothetical protein